MIRKKINEWQDRMDDGLRRICGRLTPGKQLAITLAMLLGLSVLSVYFTVSGIYRMGKEEVERLQIENIRQMKLHQKNDSTATIQGSFENGNVIK